MRELGPKVSEAPGDVNESCSTTPLFCYSLDAYYSSRQSLPSPHCLSFPVARSSSLRPLPSSQFCHFHAVFLHLTAAHSLNPFSEVLAARPSSRQPLLPCSHFSHFLAAQSSPWQPLPSPYFCHFLAPNGSSRPHLPSPHSCHLLAAPGS